MVRDLERVGHRNVGLVYVQHHGHEHLGQFEEMWSRIHPDVDALGLNGMVDGGTRVVRRSGRTVTGRGILRRREQWWSRDGAAASR